MNALSVWAEPGCVCGSHSGNYPTPTAYLNFRLTRGAVRGLPVLKSGLVGQNDLEKNNTVRTTKGEFSQRWQGRSLVNFPAREDPSGIRKDEGPGVTYEAEIREGSWEVGATRHLMTLSVLYSFESDPRKEFKSSPICGGRCANGIGCWLHPD